MAQSVAEPTKPINALDQLLQFRLADWALEFFETSGADQTPPRFPTAAEFNQKFQSLFPGSDYQQTLIVIQNIADKYHVTDIGQNIILLRQIFANLIENDLKSFEISTETVLPIIEDIKSGQTKLPKSGVATLEEVDTVIQKIRAEHPESIPPAAELPESLKIPTPEPQNIISSQTTPDLPTSPQPIQAEQVPDKPNLTLPKDLRPDLQSVSSPPKSDTVPVTKRLEDTVNLTHTEVQQAVKNLILTPAVSASIFSRKVDVSEQARVADKISAAVATHVVYSTHTADYQELSPVIASEIYENVAKEPLTAPSASKLLKSDDFLQGVDTVSENNFPEISQANVASQILLISTLADPKNAPAVHNEIIDHAVSTGLKINPENNTAKNKLVVTAAVQQVFLPAIAARLLSSTKADFEKNVPLQPQRFLQNLDDAQEQSFQSFLKHLDEKLEDKTVITAATPRYVTDTVTREILKPVNIYAQGQKSVGEEESQAAENHAFASLMASPDKQQQGYEDFLTETLEPSSERYSFLNRSVRELSDSQSRTLGQTILLKNYSDELDLYEEIPQFKNPTGRSVWKVGGFSRNYFSQSVPGQAITRSVNFVPKKSYFKFSQKFSTGRAKGALKGFAKKGAAKVATKVGLSAALGAATGGSSLLVQVALALALKFKKQIAYALGMAAFLAYMLFLWLLAQGLAFVLGFAIGATIGFALGGPIGALVGGFIGGVGSAWLYNHFPPYTAFVDNILLNLPNLWSAVTAPIGWVTSAFGAATATASFIGGAAGATASFVGGAASAIGGFFTGGGAASGVLTTLASPGVLIPTATVGGVATFSILSYNLMASALFTNPSLPEQVALPGDATEGETSNPYMQIQKLASAPSKSLGPAKTIKLENSDLPQTITYSITITANNQPVYDITCSDTITHTTKSGSVRQLPTPTINCPSSLSPTQTAVITYDLPLENNPIFYDSSINNKFSISFKSFDPGITPEPGPGGSFSNSVSGSANDLSSIFVGTPASECPSGWPVAGSGRVTQGPGGNVSHQSLEAVDIATFYTDSLLASFNGVVQYKYTDPNGNHPITGRTGYTVILSGTCNGVPFQAIYGHMDSFGSGIEVGSVVSKGQVIGYEGYTGYILPPDITGTHLHYEFRGLKMEPPYIPEDVRGCAGSCASVN